MCFYLDCVVELVLIQECVYVFVIIVTDLFLIVTKVLLLGVYKSYSWLHIRTKELKRQ